MTTKTEKNKLRVSLNLKFVALLTIPLVLISIISYSLFFVYQDQVVFQMYRNQMEATAIETLEFINSTIPGDYSYDESTGTCYKGKTDVLAAIDPTLKSFCNQSGVIITLFYGSNVIASGAEKNNSINDETWNIIKTDNAFNKDDVEINQQLNYCYFAPIKNSDNSIIGGISISTPKSDIAQTVRGNCQKALSFLILSNIVVLVLGFFYMRKAILKKLLTMNNGLQTLANGDLTKNDVMDVMSNLSAISEENAAATEQVTTNITALGKTIQNSETEAEHIPIIAKNIDENVSKFKL